MTHRESSCIEIFEAASQLLKLERHLAGKGVHGFVDTDVLDSRHLVMLVAKLLSQAVSFLGLDLALVKQHVGFVGDEDD